MVGDDVVIRNVEGRLRATLLLSLLVPSLVMVVVDDSFIGYYPIAPW